MPEVAYEQLEAYEPYIDMDYYAAFSEEAFVLLSADRVENDADVLFAKVDNLLNVASEMLEYQQYLDLVATAMQCNHSHDVVDMLRQGQHGQNLLESGEGQGAHDKDKKSSKAKKVASSVGKASFDLYTAFMKSQKSKKLSFFEKLLGAN